MNFILSFCDAGARPCFSNPIKALDSGVLRRKFHIIKKYSIRASPLDKVDSPSIPHIWPACNYNHTVYCIIFILYIIQFCKMYRVSNKVCTVGVGNFFVGLLLYNFGVLQLQSNQPSIWFQNFRYRIRAEFNIVNYFHKICDFESHYKL